MGYIAPKVKTPQKPVIPNSKIINFIWGFLKLQNRCLNFARKYSDHVIFEDLLLRNKNMYKKILKNSNKWVL